MKLKREVQQFGLGWHQDAPLFGGEQRHGINFWIALTPVGAVVGAECPGLSVIPARVARIVAPDYDLSDPKDRRGDEAVFELALRNGASAVSPVLAAGDAIAFDEMTLHRTQRLGWKIPFRETAITWIFAPSNFPPVIGVKRTPCVPVWLLQEDAPFGG
jgi:hypothetical protein